MKNRDLQDIVSELVGPIYPSADSAIDATRRENLKEYLELFQFMFMNIHNIAMEKDSQYHSSKVMGEDAYKAIGACGWSTFFNMLEYKCERQGKTFIRIGRFDPSSKMCSCGHVYRGLKLSEREWVCPKCGSVNDRDLLAACNIKRFGLQEQNLLFNKKPLAQRGSDVEVPTMDDRQEIDLKSSVPVKRQYVQV